MLTTDFLSLVKNTDVTIGDTPTRRDRVARFGLVSELGSILSALKKVILREDAGILAEHITKGELREELGDAFWYVGMCTNILCDGKDIFSECLDELESLHCGPSTESERVKQAGPQRIAEFEKVKTEFDMDKTLDNFQRAAFETRRTEGDELRDVCVAVLQQLAAQLVRCYMPESEKVKINTEVNEKSDKNIVIETAWHLAALATLNDLKLSEISKDLKVKTDFRGEGSPSVIRDGLFRKQESFPETFEIAFVPNPEDEQISEMFWLREDGYHLKLGASLKDNHSGGDGYRYHDAIHVAFAVHLGWSPNLRKFMNLKRKSDKKTDDNEDGGRAAILEEMIILHIHTYASKLKLYINEAKGNPPEKQLVESPFADPSVLTFEFIRGLHELTTSSEVFKSKEADWRHAISAGYEMYIRLQAAGGVLVANVKERTLSYRSLSDNEKLSTVGVPFPSGN